MYRHALLDVRKSQNQPAKRKRQTDRLKWAYFLCKPVLTCPFDAYEKSQSLLYPLIVEKLKGSLVVKKFQMLSQIRLAQHYFKRGRWGLATGYHRVSGLVQ